MRSPDEIAAEIEGLCAVPIWTSDEYLAGRKLLPEAAHALRARPGREEVELVLRELVGSCEKAAADERNRQIFNVPSMGSSLDRDEMIRASLRDLGFGQEGEG